MNGGLRDLKKRLYLLSKHGIPGKNLDICIWAVVSGLNSTLAGRIRIYTLYLSLGGTAHLGYILT